MSAGTVPSGSSSGGSQSQSGTEAMDQSAYIYTLPENERIIVCHYLNQKFGEKNELTISSPVIINNGGKYVWEEAARIMGYTANDIIRIKKMAHDKRISPADQLLSLWGDQNHTVTELFMVLNSLQQFDAMDCLKDHVDRKYHRLLRNALPNLKMLMRKNSDETKKNNNSASSGKILNGPEMSRDTNESEYDTDSMQTSSNIFIDRDKIEEVAGRIPQILYSDLVLATENWKKDNILGSGGFGTVFKGRWKYTDVAIKKIEYKSKDTKRNAIAIQQKQSLNELQFLNGCRHDNVLPLYGHSIDGPEPCLVYQYMSGGSLEQRLRAKKDIPLTFKKRKRIALGTARGIQYLHTYKPGRPLIHGDIKPANILLDPCCVPKIGDFGLVREGTNESMEVSSVYGTRPYLPLEFLGKREFSPKIDTFSYGVVLFELFTARRAYDTKRGEEHGKENAFLYNFMSYTFKNDLPLTPLIDELMDPATVCLELFERLMRIGLRCTNEKVDNRPEMVTVLNALEELIDDDGLP